MIHVNEIINLTGYTIELAPYGSIFSKVIPSKYYLGVTCPEEIVLNYSGMEIPLCSVQCMRELPVIEGTVYIVTQKAKKAFQYRGDVLTILEADDHGERVVVQKLGY